ncbi:MAG: hypothetical protein J1E03_02610 [Acetatifactor sp.]|nr:hypothetical protein [Acetatifactor sp.]
MATKWKQKWNNKIALLLSVVCLLTLPGVLSAPLTVQAAAQELNGHKLIAENDSYSLYMNEEYLSIIVQDKATGRYMESAVSYDDGKNNDLWLGQMRSALVLQLIYGTNDNLQADLINDDVTKTINYTNNGFSADVYWNKYKLGMTLEVELTEDGVVTRIPDESIREDDTTYYIGTITMYPYLGATYLDSKEGYMFIPDGNGALIYLDDKEGRFKSGFSSMIYGTDVGFVDSGVVTLFWDRYKMVNNANDVMAPVYGMAYTEDGIAYLAVVEDGAERATIEASPNGSNIDYNRISARFIERRLYKQPTSNNTTVGSFDALESDRSHSNLQVHYLFLSGNNANYSGMAVAYRNYLLDNGGLTVKEDSYRTRVDFLGTDREAWVIGTNAVVMTTVDDIREIYSDLETAGVTNMFSAYKGWQKGGIYNLPVTSYKADSKIGGTSELTKLFKEAAEKNIQFYLYEDALRINPDENNATFNVIKQINKRKYVEDTYKDVYEEFNFLTPARTNTLLTKFVGSAAKKSVNNIAIAGVSNTLFSYTYSGKTYTRYECADSYDQMFSALDSSTNLVLETPYAYLWKYTDAFLDMPLYTSSYIYEDESIPFMSMVLKGVIPVYSDYVNFEANKQEFFLKMVEAGTYPSFYITKESSADLIYTNSSDIYSSEYSVYRDTIIEYSKELGAVNEKVAGAFITGHEIRENGIRVVTYDNGVKIYINYSNSEQSADGHTLEGMSYKVVE